jgi:hypothetical protein
VYVGGLAAVDAEPNTVMIDATYLKAHRTPSSLRVKCPTAFFSAPALAATVIYWL